jgi:hypothetical protein
MKELNGYLYSLKEWDGHKFRMKFIVWEEDGERQRFNNDVYTNCSNRVEVERVFREKFEKMWGLKNIEVVCWISKEDDVNTTIFLNKFLEDNDVPYVE